MHKTIFITENAPIFLKCFYSALSLCVKTLNFLILPGTSVITETLVLTFIIIIFENLVRQPVLFHLNSIVKL